MPRACRHDYLLRPIFGHIDDNVDAAAKHDMPFLYYCFWGYRPFTFSLKRHRALFKCGTCQAKAKGRLLLSICAAATAHEHDADATHISLFAHSPRRPAQQPLFSPLGFLVSLAFRHRCRRRALPCRGHSPMDYFSPTCECAIGGHYFRSIAAFYQPPRAARPRRRPRRCLVTGLHPLPMAARGWRFDFD